MASTTTAAAILVLRDRAVPAADVISLASEIVRMAGSTERCVAREGPREGTVDAATVASVAAQIHPVITRVVAPGVMTEDIWRPGVGRMTHIALHIGADVIPWLRPCTTVVAVTVIATTSCAGIVEPRTADEGGRRMAEMAVCRSRHMTGMLTCCGYPMTGRAIVDDASMIEHSADKGAGVMTDTAVLIGRHVVGRLADGKDIIVAGAAVIHDACVAERCRYEAGRHVAGITIFIRWHVVGRWGLSSCGGAIVARITIAGDTRMVESGTGEGRRDMAHRAILRRRKVPDRFTGRRRAIVARGAIVDDTRMIEHGGLETAGYVTNTAIFGRRDVTRILANRAAGATIMTGVAAFAHDFRAIVIDKGVSEIGGVMADTAILVGLMNRRIRLTPGIQRHKTSIVARLAITSDTCVIKYRRRETGRCVAVVAILACW